MKKYIAIIAIAFMLASSCSSKINPPGEERQTELSEKARKGEKVFMDNCNTCHPSGRAGLGPGIFNKPLPGFMIRYQVRNGIGTMPSFDKEHISKEELDNLVKYIKEQ